jgi:hypothetical protein
MVVAGNTKPGCGATSAHLPSGLLLAFPTLDAVIGLVMSRRVNAISYHLHASFQRHRSHRALLVTDTKRR